MSKLRQRLTGLKWSALALFIFVGSFLSVFTGVEWPPFSPYPMYSWAIHEDNLAIFRVVSADPAKSLANKYILKINTTRTVTTLMTSRWTRQFPTEEMARDLLIYYHKKIEKNLEPDQRPQKLRLEWARYSYKDLRSNIRAVSKAYSWEDLDKIVPVETYSIYEL